jgi:hypothetical protein
VAAVVEREVHKFARGGEQNDPSGFTLAKKVDEFQGGAQIDGVLLSSSGSCRRNQDALQPRGFSCLLAGFHAPALRLIDKRTLDRNNMGTN